MDLNNMPYNIKTFGNNTLNKLLQKQSKCVMGYTISTQSNTCNYSIDIIDIDQFVLEYLEEMEISAGAKP
jgi:hypothetical protein